MNDLLRTVVGLVCLAGYGWVCYKSWSGKTKSDGRILAGVILLLSAYYGTTGMIP